MKKELKTILMGIFGLPVIITLSAANASAAEKIVYRLKWLHNVSAAGALYADKYHLFKEAGLSVEIKAGGPERDAIRELELGYADFGEASADQVIRARAKGSPVVVIAQLFHVNPLQWIYRPETIRIRDLSDLRGKTIGVTFGGNDETIMRTLLARGHIKDSEVTLFSVRYDYTPFYRNRVQLWPVYRNAQGPIISKQLEQAGEQTAFFNPADFGVKFVANSVVTASKTVSENPERAKRFLAALLEGWQQALDPENREKAVLALQQFDSDTPRDILEQQLAITREMIRPAADMAIGTIDEAAWEQTEKIMRDQKQIEKPVDIQTVLKPLNSSGKPHMRLPPRPRPRNLKRKSATHHRRQPRLSLKK